MYVCMYFRITTTTTKENCINYCIPSIGGKYPIQTFFTVLIYKTSVYTYLAVIIYECGYLPVHVYMT